MEITVDNSVDNRSEKMGTGKVVVSIILCIGCVILFTTVTRLPVPVSSPRNDTKDFVKVFTINATHPITKYVSKSTGLEIVHAEVQGPLIHGYIALATRPENDDGMAHSLEHLIFHGSESYPYSGTLNVLAGKCLSPGLNAYTEQTHTVFQLDTAGYAGFLTLLPIYLDHIFYPILSDESFTTEIYHVTGKGMDAGVMYSEMKGWEFLHDKRLSIAIQRTLYPMESGYRYEAGGLSKNLRESLNNTKVKQFHAKFYNPRNTRIIVTGIIKAEAMFQALDPIVKKLVDTKAADVNWTKPWLEEVPEISFPPNKTIYFPSDEENYVSVAIAFRVLSTTVDFDRSVAMEILFAYLHFGSLSPLRKAFVEVEDPLASRVSSTYREYSSNHAYFQFEGVYKDNMEMIPIHLKQTLENQLQDFDMVRMTNTIEKKIMILEGRDETNPEYFISTAVIKDFLFADNDKKLFEKRVNPISILKSLLFKPRDFWINLLQTAILNKKWTTIYSVPSVAYQQEIVDEEENRVRERQEILGRSGLDALANELNEAVQANSEKIPADVLEKINVPAVDSIYYHSIIRQEDSAWASNFKAKLFVDDIHATFVDIRVLMNTASLKFEHRKYLQLFQRYLAQAPILSDDSMEIIPFEKISSTRAGEIMRVTTRLGIGTIGFTEFGTFSNLLVLEMRLAMDKVDKGMDWIRKLLWRSVWVEDKIKAVINKDMRALKRRKEMGVTIQKVLLQNIMYKPGSNVAENIFIRQLTFLSALGKTLSSNLKNITEAFDAIRNVITNPENVVVHVSANLPRLNATLAETTETKNIAVLLNRTFPFAENTTKSSRSLANEPDQVSMTPVEELRSKPSEIILGLSAVESAYLSVVAPGPDSYSHSDLPALLVTIQYFSQHGGPFWTGVRGGGFAYTVFCYSSTTEGIIYFELEQSSDVVGAYGAAQASIEEFLMGNTTLFSEELLKSAKGSLIYEYVLKEKTPSELARASLESYYKNATGIYTREVVKMIAQVEMEEILLMTEKYLKPLFDQNYPCVVVCPLDKRDAIKEGLKKLGRKLQIMPPFQWEENAFMIN